MSELRIENTTIKIVQGDITEQETEAIVNAANNKLIMGGGVAGTIKRKGGPSIQEECNKVGPIAIGEAALTGAGSLKTKYVIHVATMGTNFETNEKYIRQATSNSLKICEEKKIASVSFPALGCGVGGFPVDHAAKIMLEEIFIHLEEPSVLKEIRFVLYTKEDFGIFEKEITEHLHRLKRKTSKHPIPTVDVIIETPEGIVLIERKNPPYGWAIPGGFVDYGEDLETAAAREAEEETSLKVENLRQFHTYSKPNRDPRFHTITTVFTATSKDKPKAASDAASVKVFTENNLPENLVFDHKDILRDYFNWKKRKD